MRVYHREAFSFIYNRCLLQETYQHKGGTCYLLPVIYFSRKTKRFFLLIKENKEIFEYFYKKTIIKKEKLEEKFKKNVIKELEEKEILKIENDKKLIEISYIAIKDVKFNKKGNGITKCYKLIIKTNRKNLKFFVRTKENYFGGATKNDFDNLENFYFFLKEKIEK